MATTATASAVVGVKGMENDWAAKPVNRGMPFDLPSSQLMNEFRILKQKVQPLEDVCIFTVFINISYLN